MREKGLLRLESDDCLSSRGRWWVGHAWSATLLAKLRSNAPAMLAGLADSASAGAGRWRDLCARPGRRQRDARCALLPRKAPRTGAVSMGRVNAVHEETHAATTDSRRTARAEEDPIFDRLLG